ncbi:MAG: ribulose-phosphate 3-epimerase [Bacteroidales bacterium]
MAKPLLAVSVLDADFSHLGNAIRMLHRSQADWIHCDIMDGSFVPNLSFGLPVLRAMRKESNKPFDVHLMMVEPERYIEAFRSAGADLITVHQEACRHLHRTIQQIRESGAKAGVCLNPATPVSSLEEILPNLDLVLLMSVNPGFGGQPFIEQVVEKAARLKQMASRLNPTLYIEVDGGINATNIPRLRDAGVNVFVVGSYIFRSPDPIATIAEIKAL